MIHSTRKWMRAALVVCCMAGVPAAAQVTQETPIDSLDDETIAKSRAAHGKNSAREEGQVDAMDYVLDSRWRAYGEDFTTRIGGMAEFKIGESAIISVSVEHRR